ncbi:esterase/lipase family protein [Nucisporomicrobium flavum]|jgi:pimeloyl-ACP methyl ester carboxylesterase|uniref:esterase/lipase family protein n=1 Tax=Nucisporomicrobium flavum TaxID=2785915 RepID=UPI0018F5E33B|nr:alpha/beta hydrolase [Nucisporomicrobium flavum]
MTTFPQHRPRPADPPSLAWTPAEPPRRVWTPGAAPPERPPEPHEAPPHWLLLSTDPGRAIGEAALSAVGRAILRAAPRGDGHPVVVLPGLGGGDASTFVLRRTLRRLGYAVHGWNLGRNNGPTADVIRHVPGLVAELANRYGRRVSIVGWSLGGIYAHAAARAHPDRVRQVITLGSPIRMTHPAQTHAMVYYKLHAHRHVPEHLLPPSEVVQPPLTMPATSIFSRWDGIVSYRASMHPPYERHENIATVSSHFGLGHHPAVLWAVADRLAQPESGWRPFEPPTMLMPLFPAPPGPDE